MPDIISKESQLFEYTQSGEQYLLTKKYVKELDLYLLVEAKVDNFTQSVKDAFYFNIMISLLITLIIASIIVLYVKKTHNKLHELASNDSLTGLPNRRVFHNQLEHFLLLKARNHHELSLLFIDVDDFKVINDLLGHDVGDEVLINIASTLGASIRSSDFIARWGGEEFIILLIDTNLQDANVIAEQLRRDIEKNTSLHRCAEKEVTISLGVAQANDNDDADSLFKRADNALYQAKEAGKNRVVICDKLLNKN
jgi:diguanylate cyclase (GGDEF)-like protein